MEKKEVKARVVTF